MCRPRIAINNFTIIIFGLRGIAAESLTSDKQIQLSRLVNCGQFKYKSHEMQTQSLESRDCPNLSNEKYLN